MVSQVTRGAVNPANAGYSAEGAIAALVGEVRTLGETNARITNELSTAQNEIIALRAPGRLVSAGDEYRVANTIAFLSSDLSDYITGETIHVNGGMYFS